MNSELAESVVSLVENCSDVQDSLTGIQGAMAFDVARHAVNKVRHGCAGVGIVGIVVGDGNRVDIAIRGKREETLVPVDVARTMDEYDEE